MAAELDAMRFLNSSCSFFLVSPASATDLSKAFSPALRPAISSGVSGHGGSDQEENIQIDTEGVVNRLASRARLDLLQALCSPLGRAFAWGRALETVHRPSSASWPFWTSLLTTPHCCAFKLHDPTASYDPQCTHFRRIPAWELPLCL